MQRVESSCQARRLTDLSDRRLGSCASSGGRWLAMYPTAYSRLRKNSCHPWAGEHEAFQAGLFCFLDYLQDCVAGGAEKSFVWQIRINNKHLKIQSSFVYYMIACLTDSCMIFIYEILQKSVLHTSKCDSKAFSITCNKSRSACLSLFIPVHGSFSTTLR